MKEIKLIIDEVTSDNNKNNPTASTEKRLLNVLINRDDIMSEKFIEQVIAILSVIREKG